MNEVTQHEKRLTKRQRVEQSKDSIGDDSERADVPVVTTHAEQMKDRRRTLLSDNNSGDE